MGIYTRVRNIWPTNLAASFTPLSVEGMLRKQRASLEAADPYYTKWLCCLQLVTPWEQKPERRKEWPCARHFENE